MNQVIHLTMWLVLLPQAKLCTFATLVNSNVTRDCCAYTDKFVLISLIKYWQLDVIMPWQLEKIFLTPNILKHDCTKCIRTYTYTAPFSH